MEEREDYEARQIENIKQKQALLQELGIHQQARDISRPTKETPPYKKRKLDNKKPTLLPARSSARIASAPARPSYREDDLANTVNRTLKSVSKSKWNPRRVRRATPIENKVSEEPENVVQPANIEELQESWSSWTPSAPAPTRDEVNGSFHFDDYPDFTPNKSPEEMLREGSFGGSYFRPLYSRSLGITVANDWQELPPSWTTGLSISAYLTSSKYDPEVNKFKVACGQSIEEWEANGWINHNFDVRGWFQWYCRFYMGRRCVDDERQVSRWKKCVGETGRWRRMLLKKYVSSGVRDVFDDGEEGEDTKEVSPVIHQTCHHWAFCLTQDVLDTFWNIGR